MTNPYIIAEVGSNWKTMREALDSISLAKACGADAVKFQLFTFEDLYGIEPDRAIGERLDGALEASETIDPLTRDWVPKLAEKASACGIDFMCTAFSPEGVDFVDPYVKNHKIASSDINYAELLERVKSKKKPIFLSVGASSMGDIRQAVELLEGSELTLLYCNSAYPSRRHNLFNIEKLRRDFKLPVGLSDHSLDVIYAPLSATRHFGATVIEKHFNNTNHTDTPDAGHALNTDEFKLMVDYIRGARDTKLHMRTSEENAMMLRHNRRLIATCDISTGTKLEYGVNFGAYRSLTDSTDCVSPMALTDEKTTPEGRPAKRDVKIGNAISYKDYLK